MKTAIAIMTNPATSPKSSLSDKSNTELNNPTAGIPRKLIVLEIAGMVRAMCNIPQKTKVVEIIPT
ncbi:hypothetical protein HORIV_46840 [Vreelandella olivaria]|uniref:Uncharacterized protein n=1 Tax=Vreelandella olivaria TaxID=390919 RepID=A0ABM7GKC5_9GAMM|nr:hypothetical protein HORIV_46840 [Halomonas olivaria]